jgi:alkylmercury lyase
MVDRLTEPRLDRLFDAIAAADGTVGVGEPHVIRTLYRLLAFDDDPVTAARLAIAVGSDEAPVSQLLERLPNVELDEHGVVVGFGRLTLRPTPHEVVIDGRTRYAWCAWDTLFLPVALDTDLAVRSACPQTRRAVSLSVSPSGVAARAPDTVVLSFVPPDAVDAADLRGTFCGEVHFFIDPAAAEQWRADAADRLVLDLDDAFDLGRRMIVNRCGCSPPAKSPEHTEAQ